jgi:hypothetical protein
VSQAASQAWAFYRELAANRVVWTIRDEQGFPTSTDKSGECAQPFWSSRARAERIVRNVPAYAGFVPFEISWEEFCKKWVPGLTKDGILAGVNWTGKRATGYDLEAERVRQCVQAMIDEHG